MSSDPTTGLSASVEKLHVNNDNTSETAPSELVAVVDDLLNQLTSKFSNLSGEILGKMDEMSRRLDSLEAAIQVGNAKSEEENES